MVGWKWRPKKRLKSKESIIYIMIFLMMLWFETSFNFFQQSMLWEESIQGLLDTSVTADLALVNIKYTAWALKIFSCNEGPYVVIWKPLAKTETSIPVIRVDSSSIHNTFLSHFINCFLLVRSRSIFKRREKINRWFRRI